jgi:hypothetical protein
VHPSHESIRKQYGYVGNTVFQLDRILEAPRERVHGKTFYLADPAVDVWEFATAIRRTLGLSPPRSVPVPLLRIIAGSGDALKATGLLEPPLTSSRLRNLRTTMLYEMRDLDDVVGPLPFTMQYGIDRTIAHLWDQGDLPGSAPARAVGERIDGVAGPPFR